MVAHFDYDYNKGSSTTNSRGVMWIPRTILGNAQMNSTDVTTGGYKGSAMNSSTIPSVVTKLQSVLGSYLAKRSLLLSNAVSTSGASMAGAGLVGYSSGWQWVDCYAALPNEVQIYGSTVFNSSFYDIGEACEKLAVFNFINHVEFSRSNFWLRSVANSTAFCFAGGYGYADRGNASASHGVRPLIVTN